LKLSCSSFIIHKSHLHLHSSAKAAFLEFTRSVMNPLFTFYDVQLSSFIIICNSKIRGRTLIFITSGFSSIYKFFFIAFYASNDSIAKNKNPQYLPLDRTLFQYRFASIYCKFLNYFGLELLFLTSKKRKVIIKSTVFFEHFFMSEKLNFFKNTITNFCFLLYC
jgi:hypothetical protein